MELVGPVNGRVSPLLPYISLSSSATSAVAARGKRSLSLLRAGQHRLETKSAHLPDRTLCSGIPRSINLQRTCEILPELGVKDLPLLPKPSSQTRQDQPTSTSMSLRLQPRHLTRNPRHITRNPRPFLVDSNHPVRSGRKSTAPAIDRLTRASKLLHFCSSPSSHNFVDQPV